MVPAFRMPLSVRAPTPPKVVLAATVTAPLAVAAVALALMSAPTPAAPAPEMFKALATVLPFKSTVPPDDTVIKPVP